MLAVDTNVIVRYLAADHPDQTARARALIEGQDVFVCTTVLLETELVLRTVYGLDSVVLARTLRAFAGLARVTLEDPSVAAQALDWMDAGMDFADALHLAKAGGCDAFVTFDRRLVRAANKLGTVRVRAP